MALFNTQGLRVKPDLPYMTVAEAAAFKKMREGDQPSLTFFRTKPCERTGCPNETLKHKRVCSEKCWEEFQKELICKIKTRVKVLTKPKKPRK